MKYDNGELCLIWLDSFLGLEYKHKQELFKMIGGKADIKELLVKGKSYIAENIGENEYNTLVNSANANYLDYVLSALERKGIVAVTITSKDYPDTLKNTPIPPLVLYCKGDIKLLKCDIFGIVGSRKNLPSTLAVAKRYADELSASGLTLITGIAEGVDATVISTAVENGRSAISVIGGGFDHLYPKSNQDLLEKLVLNGLAISEYPPDTVPKPFHFPVRNRIIAALSKGVLIVSGAMKSGTQYTAEYAEEYGKDLFAIPYGVGVAQGAGCNDLIKRGAMLTDDPKDVLDFYGLVKERKKIELNESEKAIVSVLKDGEKHTEKICAALGKRVFEITPVLSMLEMKGVISKNGVNVYGICRNDLEE